jgi:hypothetical protein
MEIRKGTLMLAAKAAKLRANATTLAILQMIAIKPEEPEKRAAHPPVTAGSNY